MPIISKESELKESFRVFSKDDEGCITAEELKFVMTHLPGKVGGEKEQNNWAFMFPTEGDVQGDRRDDPHGGQERGREDQLQRVQGDDGGAPTYIYYTYHDILYI